MATISVIVPVYNVEPYLNRCIDSILTQSFADFELILVDDGSPDNCPAICDEYAKKDNRIHVIHQKNGGLSAARNAGLDWAFANSDSEWLTFIDSDDWVHAKYIECLYNAVIGTGAEISACNFERIKNFFEPDVDLISCSTNVYSSEDFYVNFDAVSIIACAKLYKKACFCNVRYPLGKYHEDEFTTPFVLFSNKSVAYLQSALYFYYCNPTSIMNSEITSNKIYDCVEAKQKQICYFDRNGFAKAKARAAWWLTKIVADEIRKRKHYKLSAVKLRCKLRVVLHKYGSLNSCSIKNNPEYFELAYPTFMWFYWSIKAQINKYFKKNKK